MRTFYNTFIQLNGKQVKMLLSKCISAADHPYLKGPGGRFQNNQPMQGMTFSSLRKHPSLWPLFGFMMFATTLTKIIVFHNLSSNGLNWTKVKDHSEYDEDSPTLYQKIFHLSKFRRLSQAPWLHEGCCYRDQSLYLVCADHCNCKIK